MKKIIFFFLSIVFLFFVNSWVFAQPPPPPALEIEYPQLPAVVQPPTDVATPIPIYIRYIYYFIVIFGGLVALGALIYGGFLWFFSSGKPEKIKDAKDQILAALFGLIILLGSYLLLYNINPQLVVLEVPTLIPAYQDLPAGVWLCKKSVPELENAWYDIKNFEIQKEQLEDPNLRPEDRETIIASLNYLSRRIQENLEEVHKECYLVEGFGYIKEDFDNKVTDIYMVSKEEENGEFKNYAAIIFEEPNYKKSNEICYPDTVGYDFLQHCILTIQKPSSIMTFIVIPNPDPNWKVITYEEVDLNEDFPNAQTQEFPADCNYSCGNSHCCAGSLNPSPKSIENKWGAEGQWIAILTKNASTPAGWRDESEVFIRDDRNLLDNERIRKGRMVLPFRYIHEPAATAIFLISGRLY